MILISCRAGAASFGPHVTKSGNGSQPYYLRGVGGTILVHGYHTSESSAGQSYDTIRAAMPDVEMTGYLWPGGEIAIDYPLAVCRATEAGWRLRDMLNGQLGISNLDVQTHSLGARVALEALRYTGISIRHLILSAPAVNRDVLDDGGEFDSVLKNCASVNVFCSRNDPVLARDYPLGSFGGQALGMSGPVVIRPRVRVFDCSEVVTEHGGYRYAPEYYAAWKAIRDGSAAPGRTIVKKANLGSAASA